MRFTVRPGLASDVPAVLPLVRAICALHEQKDPQRFRVLPDVLDRYAHWLPERAADPRSVFLIAEHVESRDVLGFVICTIEPEVPIFWVPECGWIHDLYVVPVARKHGVGRELVRAVTARFFALGVSQIRLHTAAFNESAREFFASEGFRVCVVEMLKPLGPGPEEVSTRGAQSPTRTG